MLLEQPAAAAMARRLSIEPRLHWIKGYRHLPLLREALQREIASNAPRQERVARETAGSRGSLHRGV